MGSRRECTRILGLESFRVERIEWEADGPDARHVRSGLNGEASAATNAPAVDDGPGACEIPRCGRGTTCRGPRTGSRWSTRSDASDVGPAAFAPKRVEFADRPRARHAAAAPSRLGVDCQSMPTSHAAVRHGVSWSKARRAEHAFLGEWDCHASETPAPISGGGRDPPRQGAEVLHRALRSRARRGDRLGEGPHGGELGGLADHVPRCPAARGRRRRLHRHASALRERRRTRCCRRPRSSSTSSTSCSTPRPRSTTCGARSSFAPGAVMRAFGRGKRWLLLRRWKTVRGSKRGELQQLFAANRRLFKAYVLREQLDRLWTYKTRDGVARFLFGWLKALRWQRLPEMEKLGDTLVKHFDGIAAYCDHPVRFGVVESLNTTIKAVLRRARGMRDEAMLLLKLKWATARPIRSSRDLARFLSLRRCTQIGEDRQFHDTLHPCPPSAFATRAAEIRGFHRPSRPIRRRSAS